MYSRLTPEQNLALFIRVVKAIIATGRAPAAICREFGFQLHRYRKLLNSPDGLVWAKKIEASRVTVTEICKAAESRADPIGFRRNIRRKYS